MRIVAAIATLLLSLCYSSAATAHASLVSVEPRDGSVLAQAPKQVELRFNEDVVAGAVQLIDSSGRLRGDAVVDAKDQTIVVMLPDNLPRGTQIVSYRVISQDGHPVAGSVAFSIGEPTAHKPSVPTDSGVEGLIWLARIGLYVGLFAGIGGTFFASWIAWERSAPRAILLSLLVGMVGAIASLGLQGLDVLGLPLSSLVKIAPWKVALGTSLGPSLMIAMAAMVAGLAALQSRRKNPGRALSAAALIGVGLALAATGHAATAPPETLTRAAVFLHGVAVAYWLGAFWPLLAILRGPQNTALSIVARFSRAAMPVIGLLGLTGLALAIVQLESLRALIDTRYGIILLVKLALVTGLLALAAQNRLRLTPALAHDVHAARPLSRSILFEGALAMAILAVVAGWRFTTPPRSIVPEAPLAVHIHTDKAMFQVLISPGRVGADSFVLQLMNGDGSLLQAKEATLTLSLPDRGIEGIERDGALGKDGFWHVGGVPLPVPGRWHMRIDALVSDFQKITLEDDFEVLPQ